MSIARYSRLLAFLLGALFATPACTDAPTAAPQAQTATPALWQVKGRAGEVTIFGSVHLLRPGLDWLHGSVAKAAYGAETLTLEIHKTAEVEAKIQALTAAHGLFPPDQSLDQAVPRDLYGRALAIATGLGIPEDRFRQLKPWSASLMIGVATILKLGFDPGLGVDETLTQRLTARGVPIRSLETADDVIAALAKHPLPIQTEMLRQAIADYAQSEQLLDDLTQAWATGDLDSLDRLLHANMKTLPAFHQAVIVDRNRQWLPQIKALIDMPGRHMLVVGVGHLVGEDSLIDMLEADGYTVKRLQ